MKTEEDEAFDELAKKQGSWGGGYQAKRKMAADKMQEPAQEPVAWMRPDNRVAEESNSKIQFSRGPNKPPIGTWKPLSLYTPSAAPREWIWLSDADIAEVVDTTCQYSGGYEEYLIKKAERKIKELNT